MAINFKKLFYFIAIIMYSFLFFSIGHSQNTNTLSGGEEDSVNIFLQNTVNTNSNLKSKAEVFNGDRAGVYDGKALVCPYAFERDLFVGIRGEDVKLLQILLNTDPRTTIAQTGPGSLGNETTSFGESTKTAVREFQKIFIEYIGVANGRFGPRTRTVMNAICNGERRPNTSPIVETRQSNNVFDNIFSVQRGAVPGGIATISTNGDIVKPKISLSANVSSVKLGETFKVILTASEEIAPITPDSLIVDGGGVKEIRKLSKVSYTATINVNDDAKKVLIQVEADKVEDLAGNKNENASNEISVRVTGSTSTSTNKDGDASINSLLDKIISSAPNCTYNSNGILIQTDNTGKALNTTGCAPQQTQNLAGQTYNCNGQQIPVTQPCQQREQPICNTVQTPFGTSQQCQTPSQAQRQQAAQQDQQLAQLLSQALRSNPFGNNNSGLRGLFGGGQQDRQPAAPQTQPVAGGGQTGAGNQTPITSSSTVSQPPVRPDDLGTPRPPSRPMDLVDTFFAACPYITTTETENPRTYICHSNNCSTPSAWKKVDKNLYTTTIPPGVAKKEYFYSFSQKLKGQIGIVPREVQVTIHNKFKTCTPRFAQASNMSNEQKINADLRVCAERNGSSTGDRSMITNFDNVVYVQKNPGNNEIIERAFTIPNAECVNPGQNLIRSFGDDREPINPTSSPAPTQSPNPTTNVQGGGSSRGMNIFLQRLQ